MSVSTSGPDITFPAPIDFICGADRSTLIQYLGRSERKLRRSLHGIETPKVFPSDLMDENTKWHTIRMLAACHDNRTYITNKPVYSDYDEYHTIFGLRHLSHEGAPISFDLISTNDSAHRHAKALVAVTNLWWNVTATMLKSPEADIFRIEEEEVWLKSRPHIELVQRHYSQIDRLLNAIDQRCTINVEELETIMSSGALGTGAL